MNAMLSQIAYLAVAIGLIGGGLYWLDLADRRAKNRPRRKSKQELQREAEEASALAIKNAARARDNYPSPH